MPDARHQGKRIVVIGAGIAGLTAAFRLRQAGCDVTVLERSDHVGGRMSTAHRNGYRIDVAASLLPGTYRAMLRLIYDAGLIDQIRPTGETMGFFRDGRAHRMQASSMASMVPLSYLGAGAKLAVARVAWQTHRRRRQLHDRDPRWFARWDAEDVMTYSRRTMPPEALDYFSHAFTRAMALVPPEELSAVNLWSWFAAMIGAAYFNSEAGVQFLPDGLARTLHVKLEATATSVEETGTGARVTWTRPGEPEHVEEAFGAVIALPAPHLLPLYRQLSAEQTEFLRGLPYMRSLSVSLGLSRIPDEPSMWLTIPAPEHPELTTILFDHNRAPGRAPAGHGLISTYWMRSWADRHWELDDEKVIASAVAEASRFVPELGSHLDAASVWRWDPCTVAWPPNGYRALREFVRSREGGSRVQLAGDYFGTSLTNNSLQSGERAAASLLREPG